MGRTALTLLAAALACGLVALAAVSGGRSRSGLAAPEPAIASPAAVAPAPAADPIKVLSPTGAVLAEMDRRLGTPRRVLIEARRRAREIARLERKLAALQAAARAAALARIAALQSQQPWYDPAAAAAAHQGPSSPAEAHWLASEPSGWVEPSGYARAPASAPVSIKSVIQAGNTIARSPYVWGGGHGAWRDSGYDCSGSVSYALASGGLLGSSETSGQLMGWGAPGPGRWLTVYASPTHVFMIVAGLRFDTSGRAGDHASRWQLAPRSADGFAVRHYPGL